MSSINSTWCQSCFVIVLWCAKMQHKNIICLRCKNREFLKECSKVLRQRFYDCEKAVDSENKNFFVQNKSFLFQKKSSQYKIMNKICSKSQKFSSIVC